MPHIRVLAVVFLPALLLAADKMARPQFTSDQKMIRPEGYREWMFVGANLGMGYSENTSSQPGEFHNIYVQPEAYRAFKATGRFPNHTMFVMERVTAGTGASINKKGHFEDRFIGIEVAVKAEDQFPEKWAYFEFVDRDGKQLPTASAFAKTRCWACHNTNGATDNVFVQFYPVLRDFLKTAKN